MCLRFILHCVAEGEGGFLREERGRVLWYCYWYFSGTYRFGELVQRGIYAIRIARRRLWRLRCGHRGSGSETVDLHTSPATKQQHRTAPTAVLCTVLYCIVLCARLTGIHYSKYGSTHNNLQSTHTLTNTYTHTHVLPTHFNCLTF